MGTIGMLFLARLNGQRDEEVHDVLGFGSEETMRTQLRLWGLPDDLVAEKPKGETAKIQSDARAPARERRARGSEKEPVKLPAAGRAFDLFEGLVDGLSVELLKLKFRTEYLKDGRFVAGVGWKVVRSVPREEATGEDADVIEVVEADPDDLPDGQQSLLPDGQQSLVEWRVYDSEELEDTGWRPELLGGSAVPPEPLVSLCALYVLRGGNPKDLVDLLHPDPGAVPLEKLTGTDGKKGIARRLREEARRLAAMVRGKDKIGGRDPNDISVVEHTVGRYITRKRRAGVPDARILEELRSGAVDGVSDMSRKEFDRLGELRLDRGTGPLPEI